MTTLDPTSLGQTRSRLVTAVMLAAIAASACRSPAPPAPQTAPAPAAATPAPTAAPNPSEAAAPDYKNTIRWSTASEVENFAYDVYRGLSEDGPFQRMTTSPIPGAGTSDETNRYVFVDRDIDPRQEYYYYVESISLAGVREKFTPVTKAKAKLGAEVPQEE